MREREPSTALSPDVPGRRYYLLQAVPAAPRPGMTPVLPVDYWRNENDFLKRRRSRAYQFVSPDGTTFLPAGEDFVTGELYYGSKFNDTLRAFGLAPAVAGQPYYVSDESGEKNLCRQRRAPTGQSQTCRLFAEQGGESVTVDDSGNVYIAAGQVFVYDPSGDLIDTIEIPERPSQLLFGGSDRHIRCSFLRAVRCMSVQTIEKGAEKSEFIICHGHTKNTRYPRETCPRLASLVLLLCLSSFLRSRLTKTDSFRLANQSAATAAPPLPQLVDITDSTGIKFDHLSSPEQKYIVESMSGGVALIDYDRDGWPDIYFTNAQSVEMALAGKKSRSALYHNNHDGTFTDVTDKAGVGYPCWAMGAVVGDYNNDGWPDLLVTCFGGVVLYRNNGDGTFTDVTKAGVA